MSNYKKLGILGIYGQRTRIEFIITPKDILLMFFNKKDFNEKDYLKKHGLKNIEFKYLDNNWIYYKLPDNKKYNFY